MYIYSYFSVPLRDSPVKKQNNQSTSHTALCIFSQPVSIVFDSRTR